MPKEKIPLVSVVIPMFNAARFIERTLASLLKQTLKNFEVIIVNDGSTDNSVELIENFAPRLIQAGIKIYIVDLPQNTGLPGLVRNVGIDCANGKYIAFMDSDDLFMPTALEELATLAEDFQADVVHTDTYFLADDKTIDDLIVYRDKKIQHVDAPTFETTDLSQRVLNWISRAYNWEPFTMFCRREFLTANQIYFPHMRNNDDMIFNFKLLCLTEKFLRVPNLIYIYRQRTDSVSTKKFAEPDAHFHKWLRELNDGLNALDEFTASEKFFADYPEYRAAVSEFFLYEILKAFEVYYTQFSAGTFDVLIKREFHAEDAALAATLFNVVNIYRLQLRQLQAKQ